MGPANVSSSIPDQTGYQTHATSYIVAAAKNGNFALTMGNQAAYLQGYQQEALLAGAAELKKG